MFFLKEDVPEETLIKIGFKKKENKNPIIIGIKYMMSSSEGKASYKKQAIPYLIGAALTFAGCNIIQVVYDAVNGL